MFRYKKINKDMKVRTQDKASWEWAEAEVVETREVTRSFFSLTQTVVCALATSSEDHS